MAAVLFRALQADWFR